MITPSIESQDTTKRALDVFRKLEDLIADHVPVRHYPGVGDFAAVRDVLEASHRNRSVTPNLSAEAPWEKNPWDVIEEWSEKKLGTYKLETGEQFEHRITLRSSDGNLSQCYEADDRFDVVRLGADWCKRELAK